MFISGMGQRLCFGVSWSRIEADAVQLNQGDVTWIMNPFAGDMVREESFFVGETVWG